MLWLYRLYLRPKLRHALGFEPVLLPRCQDIRRQIVSEGFQTEALTKPSRSRPTVVSDFRSTKGTRLTLSI